MKQIQQWMTSNFGFALFLGLMFVFRSACADWNYVPSSSMNPTLIQGDRVAINTTESGALDVQFNLYLPRAARWWLPLHI